MDFYFENKTEKVLKLVHYELQLMAHNDILPIWPRIKNVLKNGKIFTFLKTFHSFMRMSETQTVP